MQVQGYLPGLVLASQSCAKFSKRVSVSGLCCFEASVIVGGYFCGIGI